MKQMRSLKYQEGLQKLVKGSEFVFDSVDLLCYKLHRIIRNRGVSYIESPDWLKVSQQSIQKIMMINAFNML